MNPFMMFGGPPPNPFSTNTMFFEIDAIHDDTGNVKEGVLSVTVPHTATELQARKMIMEMAYQCGFRLRQINRVPDAEVG